MTNGRDTNFWSVLQQIIDAMPGEKIVYFGGHLSEDAFSPGPVRGTRDGAWEAYERGFCFLTQQRRLSKGQTGFDYVATRSHLGHR